MPRPEKPNIVLIVTDQHRADHLGCYGNGIVRTPNIDSIAARGLAFDRFYVASPICMPNRATIMTGKMPSAHGVPTNGLPLPLESVTFVDLLRNEGYRTAMVGKCHLQNMTPIAVEDWNYPAPRAGPPAAAGIGRIAQARGRRTGLRSRADRILYRRPGPRRGNALLRASTTFAW